MITRRKGIEMERQVGVNKKTKTEMLNTHLQKGGRGGGGGEMKGRKEKRKYDQSRPR